MSSAFRYNAFISYRHREPDEAIAQKVQAMLENFRAPRGIARGKAIRKIFRDTSELPTSGDLDNALKDALSSSEYLIVILSEATKESKWCMEEIRFFREIHDGRTNRILPVLVSGEPDDVIPDLLRYEDVRETLPDGTERFTRQEKEPICADIRAATSRQRNTRLKTEVLRLAAPLLGCGFDDLYQRHRKRRRRRTAVILAVCAAIVIGFVGLILRNNAQIRRKNAELESANEALTTQQRELLIRESSLLTESAGQAIREGDKLSAMREALSALPRNVTDADRPLYTPAESILWQLMEERENRFAESGRYTFGTVLFQKTVVQDYCLSSDARYKSHRLKW